MYMYQFNLLCPVVPAVVLRGVEHHSCTYKSSRPLSVQVGRLIARMMDLTELVALAFFGRSSS